jgi:hypothetical protein
VHVVRNNVQFRQNSNNRGLDIGEKICPFGCHIDTVLGEYSIVCNAVQEVRMNTAIILRTYTACLLSRSLLQNSRSVHTHGFIEG